MFTKKYLLIVPFFILMACTNNRQTEMLDEKIRLMTLNPGHFHAALVQKAELEGVDSTVHIFSPGGDDLSLHMSRIESFNTRDETPTRWQSEIYTGPDYLETMLNEKPGNVMVTAGNNRLKTDYILQAVSRGIHVLSDKPMAIDTDGWEKLNRAFETAENNHVLLYDMMTERHEAATRLQRHFSQNEELFGVLETGSPENPAVVKESIHHLYKIVSGEPLRRPVWYFDTAQQGEGIVDVTTHLVDLSLWGTFPEEAISHERDIEMIEASRWPTPLTPRQFENITGHSGFPDFLENQIEDGVLNYYSNGEIIFTIRGHHIKVGVQWNYQAPEGGGDSHFSMMRGTKAVLTIRQGAEQHFVSTLYVTPADGVSPDETEETLAAAVENLQDEFPGLSYQRYAEGFQMMIPEELHAGHEAHFGRVAGNFFHYLQEGALPGWEIPNMITKYYITTTAREMAMEE